MLASDRRIDSVSPSTDDTTKPQGSCAHCGLPIPPGRTTSNSGPSFCCAGCEFVFGTLQGLGLQAYYRRRGEDLPRRAVIAPRRGQYGHFDDPAFQTQYVTAIDPHSSRIVLFLDGVHCAACIWLLERLPEIVTGVTRAEVHFARSEIEILFDPSVTTLSTVAATLHSLGYSPAPLRSKNDDSARRTANRRFLLRIGVAGVCSMNIMMLAVSLYQGDATGIASPYRSLFSWTSLLLSLPVLLFSAVPFYRTALGGLRSGVLHIDLPIVIAIIGGFGLSVYQTLVGGSHIYYDSITALVLLLLAGRWVQHRTIERVTDAATLRYAVSPRVARLHPSGEERFVESLSVGDCVLLKSGERAPVDGEVLSGSGVMSTAILTGESRGISVGSGDIIYAGSDLRSGELVVKSTKIGADTRIGLLMQYVERAHAQRASLETFLDRSSRRFTAIVLILALGTFYFWLPAGLFSAVHNSLALLVVTCPCVLAVATPLTFSLAINRAARGAILLKGADVIERIDQTHTIVFDKTGTLTLGEPEVVAISEAPEVDLRRARAAVFSLEEGVIHPCALALRQWAAVADREHSLSLEKREILPGKGVCAEESNGGKWQIGNARWVLEPGKAVPPPLEHFISHHHSMGHGTAILSGPECLIAFAFGDPVRADARASLDRLRDRGLDIRLLSGDASAVVQSIGAELGIDADRCEAEVSPEQKAARIASLQGTAPTMMIGDGVNDAAALAAAHAGVGVHGGAEVCMRSADIFIGREGVSSIVELFEGSARTLRVVKRNLIFSALYNALGGTLAMIGVLGPLHAAILMPISSLTVILTALASRTFSER